MDRPADSLPAGPPPVEEPGEDRSSVAGSARSTTPLRDVLGLVAFRRFLGAQFLSALVNGTLRFALVWITLDLTDWDPAVGLVGLALGSAGLFVAVPAGAWSDRLDRRTMFVRASAVTTVVLVATVVVVALEVGVAALAVCAGVLGGLLAAVAPTTQAMVPALVPPERLMNGVAIQMMAMNAAMLLGAVVGGGSIALLGNAGGIAVLVVAEAVATWLMARVDLPARAGGAPTTSLGSDIVDGLRWALRREPIRSLLAVMVVIGFMWGGVVLLMPEVAKEEMGAGAFASSVLFAPLGLGVLTSSTLLANRSDLHRRGRWLSVAFVLVAGPFVILMGLSRAYWVVFVLMALWGGGGGVMMTVQRTLLQEETPEEMMGRAMGLNTLGLLGAFPASALAISLLSARFDSADTLVVIGVTVLVVALALTVRPVLRQLD